MTTDRPRIDNAPGLTWRRLLGGWEARWRPRTDLVKRGYPAMPWKLWVGWELTDGARRFISDSCISLQDRMLVWGRGGIPVLSTFDGTLHGLIYCYQTDPDSNYQKLRIATRTNYDRLLKRVAMDRGALPLKDIRARDLLGWHREWSAEGHIVQAHGLIGILRTLCTFGATILDDPECQRLKGLMHDMRFKMGKPRVERLTAEQATAVRAMAHQMGRPSIALAQAFQFECMLRQKDVIGEWVPNSEPGVSDITDGNEKWLRGLRWSEIDENLILRHTTSKRGKDIPELDLHRAPMVMEELAKLAVVPTTGPVIISEKYGLPYISHEFRHKWREIAKAAGVPDQVFNMDSRAGAISEATDAGAELEHIRHAATHSDIAMTQRYSRGSIEKTANVMKLRVEHRNKK